MPLPTGEIECRQPGEVPQHLEHHELFDARPERQLPRLFELPGERVVVRSHKLLSHEDPTRFQLAQLMMAMRFHGSQAWAHTTQIPAKSVFGRSDRTARQADQQCYRSPPCDSWRRWSVKMRRSSSMV